LGQRSSHHRSGSFRNFPIPNARIYPGEALARKGN